MVDNGPMWDRCWTVNNGQSCTIRAGPGGENPRFSMAGRTSVVHWLL